MSSAEEELQQHLERKAKRELDRQIAATEAEALGHEHIHTHPNPPIAHSSSHTSANTPPHNSRNLSYLWLTHTHMP